MNGVLQAYLAVGRQAVLEAGEMIRAVREGMDVGMACHPDGTPKTAGNRSAEARVAELLLTAFPEHRFHGEATGFSPAASTTSCLWAFAATSGAWAYCNGETTVCSVLTLLEEGRTVLGLAHNPCTGELFEASRQGVMANGRPLPLVRPASLATGVINYQIPRCMREEIDAILDLWGDRRVRRVVCTGGSPTYSLARVAQGSYAAYILAPTHAPIMPWDLTAGILLVERAGGRVSDLRGNPIAPLTHTGWLVAGTNKKIHTETLELLQRYGLGLNR
ncbi:MAG: inositol monophosphatase [Magnetococcales bacterium]|nr:inositol monophosphatase [Magnetococcales bacterium]MBF0322134.1 inositol monophosphatase [Magnetococcales bacterium]